MHVGLINILLIIYKLENIEHLKQFWELNMIQAQIYGVLLVLFLNCLQMIIYSDQKKEKDSKNQKTIWLK